MHKPKQQQKQNKSRDRVVIMLTNQVLDYNESRVIPRLVVPRLENVDKTPKLDPRITLGLDSDLGIASPRLTLE